MEMGMGARISEERGPRFAPEPAYVPGSWLGGGIGLNSADCGERAVGPAAVHFTVQAPPTGLNVHT